MNWASMEDARAPHTTPARHISHPVSWFTCSFSSDFTRLISRQGPTLATPLTRHYSQQGSTLSPRLSDCAAKRALIRHSTFLERTSRSMRQILIHPPSHLYPWSSCSGEPPTTGRAQKHPGPGTAPASQQRALCSPAFHLTS